MIKNLAATPTSTITRLSPAKINLFLHITGKRADGYHNLQTVFRLLDWGDYLHFSVTDDVVISTVDNALDANELCHQLVILAGAETITADIEDNLIFKAARVLLAAAIQSNTLPEQLAQVHISLDKHLPMGAGLGGGSSNAATTLIVLNQLWQCGLNDEQLAAYGVQLGADVPIFIFGQNAWAEGVGEHLSFIDLAQKQFIVLKPDCFISTQLLFSQKTLTRDTKPTTFCAYQLEPSLFGNNFEPLARQLYPEVEEAMQYLDQFGQAKLTGTGACVFTEVIQEMNVKQILQNAPCKAYLVNGLAESPLRHFKVTD